MFQNSIPLAAAMRPRTLSEIVGQQALLAAGSPLRLLAEPSSEGLAPSAVSLILWGPPGTGKTSLAKIVATSSQRKFIELSAVSTGVKEVRDAIERARNDQEAFGQSTVLFLDEIHRFSKAQQDVLLPAVESGWIVLIAATTENPSFSVISPLLSRSLLLTLQPLTQDDILGLIQRAMTDSRGLRSRFTIDTRAATQISVLSGGDARRALTILEAAAASAEQTGSSEPFAIGLEQVESAMDRALVRYDHNGDQHYDVISAFIKSVRGSDADAAIHYLARMIEAGEDPRFIARRLIILASEDIGLADPAALTLAVSTAEAVQLIGMPEGRIPLAEATIYLSLAPKSNSAYNAINKAIADVHAGLSQAVPAPLRSSNYSGAEKTTGAGLGYLYPHDDQLAVVAQKYLAGPTESRIYYEPRDLGAERDLAQRWQKLRNIVRGYKKPN